MTAAVHSAARVTQPKPKKIRKNRQLEQHRIRARWTFDDPNNIKESCSAVGQKPAAVHSATRVKQPKPKRIRKNRKLEQHRIRASQRRSDDPNNIKESCAAVGHKHWIANNTREEPDRSLQKQTYGRIFV